MCSCMCVYRINIMYRGENAKRERVCVGCKVFACLYSENRRKSSKR